MIEEPEYPSRETITLATACSYAVARSAVLYASHTSAVDTLVSVVLLLAVELPLVTLLVALVVNGFVLHILGGWLRRLGLERMLSDRQRHGRPEDLKRDREG